MKSQDLGLSQGHNRSFSQVMMAPQCATLRLSRLCAGRVRVKVRVKQGFDQGQIESGQSEFGAQRRTPAASYQRSVRSVTVSENKLHACSRHGVEHKPVCHQTVTVCMLTQTLLMSTDMDGLLASIPGQRQSITKR